MNKELMKRAENYESPVILRQEVELEPVMSASGQARMKVSANAADSKEETWVDNNLGGEYDIDM